MPSKIAAALLGLGAYGVARCATQGGATFVALAPVGLRGATEQVQLRGRVAPAPSEGSSLASPVASLALVGVAAAAAGSSAKVQRSRRSRVVRLAAVNYKTAFLFPGQGAQTVGMCKELTDTCPAAKALFDKASGILGYDLLDVCVNGPKEKLDTTAVSQPAIFVASMAAVEKFKQDGGSVDDATVAMGLSLGEYSALCFAGALDFEDGVKITKARGEAMQAAADAVQSSMVSVIGLDAEKTEALCKAASEQSGKSVKIANYLCTGNYTVSGDKEACAKLVEIAKPEFKARMAVPLAVAGAFHTDFMAPAVGKLKEALAAANIKAPRIPVVSNVDAEPHGEPASIRDKLARQVTAPVLWEKQMQALVASGQFEKGFELGPGAVIAGIMKRIDKAAAANISNVTA